jgi:hypothetical protein
MPAVGDPVFLRDSYSSTAFAEVIDRSLNATIARFTAGLAPMTVIGAYADWAAHLAGSPGKRLQLVEKAFRKWLRLVQYAARRTMEKDGCELASIRCRRTDASWPKRGGGRPMISFTRRSC